MAYGPGFNFGKLLVTFELNALLDLSCGAATKVFCLLVTEFLLQVLSESTW